MMTSEQIQHDLPCARCGYNLRGLSHSSRCPECAESTEDSIAAYYRDGPFNAADAPWLGRITRVPVLMLVAVMLWTPYAEQWYIIGSPSAYPALVCLMHLSPLVGWLAAWEVARTRRSTSAAHGGVRKRGVVLRTFATAALAAFYLRLLFLRGAYASTVLVVYAAGVMVASALLYRVLAEVLARVAAPRLARWLRWASWGVPAVLLLHLLVYDRLLGTYLASHRYWWHLPAIGWGPVANLGALWWDLTRLAPTEPRWWSAAAVLIRTIALPPLLIASAITLWRARRRAAHAGRTAASSRP